ncbi:MAG: hypothetical protein QXZ59_05370 [Nitrososphaeria archaeon]
MNTALQIKVSALRSLHGTNFFKMTTTKCWNCGKPYKASWIELEELTFFGPEDFTFYELK